MDREFSLIAFPETLKRWQKLLPYALLLSITFALYCTTAYFNFEWDDHLYIEQNTWIQKLSLLHLKTIWSGSYLGHYAPINISFLAVLYHFFGLDPFGYHVAQILLHAICVCLLYFTLQRLEAPRIAFLATLLFAIHPTNIETVAWIAELKSTLGFLFFLLSFLAFIRLRTSQVWWYAVPCTVFLILSILSKINTVVASAIFLLYDYRQKIALNRDRILSLLWFFFISAAFVLIHVTSFFGSRTTLAKGDLRESYYGGLAIHLANIPFMVLFYLRMIIFPHPLTAWHMFPVHEHFDWAVACGWLALLGMGWLVYRSNRNTQFWGLWFLVFLLPVLQIIPNLTWVAERYLYIPAIGPFVLLSGLFFALWDRLRVPWRRWSWEFAAIFILAVLAWRTEDHLPVFRDDLTLWGAAAATCQTSAMCHAGLGQAYLDDNQIERGVQELIRTVEIRPTPANLSELGDAFTVKVGDYRQAIIAYQMALQAASPYPAKQGEIYAKMARVYLLSGNIQEGEKAMQTARTLSPNDPFILLVQTFYEWKHGNIEQARQLLGTVLSVADRNSAIAPYINFFWGNAAQVGQLLADLQPGPGPQPITADRSNSRVAF